MERRQSKSQIDKEKERNIDKDSDEIYLKKNGNLFYEVIKEPQFCISRNLFGVNERDFHIYEQNKFMKFTLAYKNDKRLQTKVKSNNLEEFFKMFFLDSSENIYRFLNLVTYDVDKSINIIFKFLLVIKKLKIPPQMLIDLMSENYSEVHNIDNKAIDKDKDKTNQFDKIKTNEIKISLTRSKSFTRMSSLTLLGKDKSSRPIISFDISNFAFPLVKEKNKSLTIEILKSVIMTINKIMNEEFINGEIEQFTIFLDLGNITQNDLIENYNEMIKLFQFIYPSRIHKIYISIKEELYILLQHSFLQYNLSRVVVFNHLNKVLIKKMTQEISPELIFNFFIKKTLNITDEETIIDIKNRFVKDFETDFTKEKVTNYEKDILKEFAYENKNDLNDSIIKFKNQNSKNYCVVNKDKDKGNSKDSIINNNNISNNKDKLKELILQRNFTFEKSNSEARESKEIIWPCTSKDLISTNNSNTWVDNNFEIDHCDLFSIKSKIVINRYKNISIGSESTFTINTSLNDHIPIITSYSNSDDKMNIIYERDELPLCCSKSNKMSEKCFIL